MAAVVFPVLKRERNGLEKHWENEAYFPAIYYTMLVSIAYLFAPLRYPSLGIAMTVCVIFYLIINESYQEIHIASMYMAVLFGQLWVFICAATLNEGSENGSDLLFGWIPAIIIGYSLLPIKAQFIMRNLKELPIDK